MNNRPVRSFPGFVVVFLVSLVMLALVSGCDGPVVTADEGDGSGAETENDSEGPRTVEFPAGAEWLNTSSPLTMEGLQGRYVLLDFWTYGCINCYHMVPNLNELHTRYPDALVVIGVHSAKFSHESETDNIRDAVQRYEIAYPVLNDSEMVLWQSYFVPGWPTVLLIDPDGGIVGGHVGEWPLEMFTSLLDQLLEGTTGNLPPLPAALASAGRPELPPTVLRYPEGVYWDEESGVLYISDTGNHRVIAVEPGTGVVKAVFGNGVAGFSDGTGSLAQFRRPRGITRLGDLLYVADTGNHAIRTIDPGSGSVRSVARGSLFADWGLRSPWGLASAEERLYIANAGEHQIWRFDPASGDLSLFAGSGEEGIGDGTAETAEFSQPSGLFFDNGELWVADPESSAIRSVSIPAGDVRTIVGSGLFEFGDRDGPVKEALLMHATDVIVVGEDVIILDTYNSKVKRLAGGMVATLPIAGLNEPKALALQDDRIWIADTNNHRIVSVPATGGAVEALRITPDAATRERTLSVRQDLRSGGLELFLSLPEEYTLNVSSPNTAALRNVSGDEYAVRITSSQSGEERVSIDWQDVTDAGVIDPTAARQSLQVELWLYYCRQQEPDVCLFDGATYTVAIERDADATTAAVIRHRVGA